MYPVVIRRLQCVRGSMDVPNRDMAVCVDVRAVPFVRSILGTVEPRVSRDVSHAGARKRLFPLDLCDRAVAWARARAHGAAIACTVYRFAEFSSSYFVDFGI